MATDPKFGRDAAKVAINTRLAGMSKAERDDMTRAARAAQLKKLEDEVDPDRSLTPKERARRVKYAIDARMARVRLARHQEQRRQAEQNEALDTLADDEAGTSA